MGWAEDALKENLVAFVKTFDLALKRFRYFNYLNLLFLNGTWISFACAVSAAATITSSSEILSESQRSLHLGRLRNPHLRHYLFSFSGLKSLLDVSFQESPIQALIGDSSNLIAKNPPMFFPEL
jgi:hypothetical protein